MRMIHILSMPPGLLRAITLHTLLAAICAVLAAHPVRAQEGGAPAASGGDGATAAPDGAAATNRDVEPFTPQRGPAGLQRRANLKALIANAPNKAAGLPPANLRIVPSPQRPAMEAGPARNAIGTAMPVNGLTSPAVNGSAGIGSPAGNIANVAHQAPPLPKAGQTLRGAGINGTEMGRAASSSGFIGGPAKDRSGINGTLTPPRH